MKREDAIKLFNALEGHGNKFGVEPDEAFLSGLTAGLMSAVEIAEKGLGVFETKFAGSKGDLVTMLESGTELAARLEVRDAIRASLKELEAGT